MYLTNQSIYMQMSHVTFKISELAWLVCRWTGLMVWEWMTDWITINPNAKLDFLFIFFVRWNRFMLLIRFWCYSWCILLNEAFVARFKMQHLCESSRFLWYLEIGLYVYNFNRIHISTFCSHLFRLENYPSLIGFVSLKRTFAMDGVNHCAK